MTRRRDDCDKGLVGKADSDVGESPPFIENALPESDRDRLGRKPGAALDRASPTKGELDHLWVDDLQVKVEAYHFFSDILADETATAQLTDFATQSIH
jgi:hypothetical protein